MLEPPPSPNALFAPLVVDAERDQAPRRLRGTSDRCLMSRSGEPRRIDNGSAVLRHQSRIDRLEQRAQPLTGARAHCDTVVYFLTFCY